MSCDTAAAEGESRRGVFTPSPGKWRLSFPGFLGVPPAFSRGSGPVNDVVRRTVTPKAQARLAADAALAPIEFLEIEPNVIVDVIVIDLRSGSEATGGSETRPYNRDKGDVNVGAIHESPLRCLAAEQDLVAATACRTLPLTACGEEVCDPQRQRPRPKHWESSRASRT